MKFHATKNQTNNYKILLVDDHPIVREGLKKIINKSAGLTVVEEASNGEELLEKLKSTSCDLIVLDISMPKMDGLEALALIKLKYPHVKILIVTMHKEKEYFRLTIKKGINGYVLKDDGIEKIVLAIKDIQIGKKYYSSDIIPYFIDEYPLIQESTDIMALLTKREKEILKLVVSGYTSKAMAEELGISKRTADNHRFNVMEKLNVSNIAELIKLSFLKGLI